jgi:hypothetical protein
MTRPIVMDVIARDNASKTFKAVAASQSQLARQTEGLSKSDDNLRKAQLTLIASQERYNKVARDSGASVGKLASAQSSLISAQQRVRKATDDTAKSTEQAATKNKAHFSGMATAAAVAGVVLFTSSKAGGVDLAGTGRSEPHRPIGQAGIVAGGLFMDQGDVPQVGGRAQRLDKALRLPHQHALQVRRGEIDDAFARAHAVGRLMLAHWLGGVGHLAVAAGAQLADEAVIDRRRVEAGRAETRGKILQALRSILIPAFGLFIIGGLWIWKSESPNPTHQPAVSGLVFMSELFDPPRNGVNAAKLLEWSENLDQPLESEIRLVVDDAKSVLSSLSDNFLPHGLGNAKEF